MLVCDVVMVHLHNSMNIWEPQYEKILELIARSGEYYVVMADFNAISANKEKEGGRLKAPESNAGFMNFINREHLIDLGYVGYQFTWCNRNF